MVGAASQGLPEAPAAKKVEDTRHERVQVVLRVEQEETKGGREHTTFAARLDVDDRDELAHQLGEREWFDQAHVVGRLQQLCVCARARGYVAKVCTRRVRGT